MSRSQVPTEPKTFTIEQANAALPLVRAIVTDLVELARDVIERRQRLAVLYEGRRRDAFGPYREEMAHVLEELERDGDRLDEFVRELEQLGVELKSPTEGLIDFPAMFDGRMVYLCWKLGEPKIAYWHELEAGFQGRQPLVQLQ